MKTTLKSLIVACATFVGSNASAADPYYVYTGSTSWNLTSPAATLSANSVGNLFAGELTLSNGDYITLSSKTGTEAGDWTTINADRFGPNTKDAPVAMGSKMPAGKTTDNCWKYEGEGETVTVLFNKPYDQSQSQIIFNPTFYLKGNFDGWTSANELTYAGNNEYEIELTAEMLKENGEYKLVTSADDNAIWIGKDMDSSAGNFTINATAGQYLIVNFNNMTMTTSAISLGINEIEANDAPVEIYSINGVKMNASSASDLERGIYIVKQGNSAKKMMVK